MAYRDDLEAAQIRIAELEAELADQQGKLQSLQNLQIRHHDRQRRRPWLWLVFGGLAVLVLIGAGAGQALYAQERHVVQDVQFLEHQLEDARAEADQAREQRKMAYEAAAHAYDRIQRERTTVEDVPEDPEARAAVDEPPYRIVDGVRRPKTDPSGYLLVAADRPSRVGIDGTIIHDTTPTVISLSPGQHAISIIADDGRVERHTVMIRETHTTTLHAYFDR